MKIKIYFNPKLSQLSSYMIIKIQKLKYNKLLIKILLQYNNYFLIINFKIYFIIIQQSPQNNKLKNVKNCCLLLRLKLKMNL